jgi:nitroreductase
MNTYLENLHWRYATKKFDASKKISSNDLNSLLEVIRLSASSYGLQPYHVFVIEDPEIRTKLKAASWNQSQITDASQLLVFAHKTTFDESLVDTFLENISETRQLPLDQLQGYGELIKTNLLKLSEDQKAIWTSRQAYIALGNLLSAAANLKIDACPMEGFVPEKVNEILGLKEKQLNAVVLATIGYRSSQDVAQHYKKVRQSKNELFTYL